MQFDGADEGAASFFAFRLDAAEGVKRKLGIDGQNFFVAKEDGCVHTFAAGEAVLRSVLRGRQGIL